MGSICQSHNIQYIKLKEMVISKWEIWIWQIFLVPGEIFLWIFVVPCKIPQLCNNRSTIWLKIYPCFLSQITIYNLPTWHESPCTNKMYIVLKVWKSEFCYMNLACRQPTGKLSTKKFHLHRYFLQVLFKSYFFSWLCKVVSECKQTSMYLHT